LIGDKLVFYAPMYLSLGEKDPFQSSFPALRKWRRGADDRGFRQIAAATRVYQPVDSLAEPGSLALHTVTVCDLAQRELDCEATGELRSHGFFYKPDGRDSGLLGLPIREAGRPGYEHLFNDSASVLYLHNRGLDFAELGTLTARPDGAVDDRCRASCVDWYGNARPLFLRGRVFALLGYELVEGALSDGRIRERQRVSFAPQPAQLAR
jgi:hypothetical protein